MQTRRANQILWENVLALMTQKFGGENLTQFAAFVKIGPGTITRIKQQKTSVGIDIVERIARRFHLEPWQLMVPDLVANSPPMLAAEAERIKELLANIQRSTEAVSGLLRHDGNTDNGDLT